MHNCYFRGEAIFSAGGVLVDEGSKRVLLVYKEAINEWLLPKGRMNDGETVEQTAEREIYEETGYKNEVGKLLSVQIRPDVVDPSKSKVVFWFYSKLLNGDKAEGTQENHEDFSGEWFEKNKAMEMLKWDDDKKLVDLILE